MYKNTQLNKYNQSSYDAVPAAGNPTYSEAWALIEAARRMSAPIQRGDVSADPELRKEAKTALRLNWRLWTIFQTELSIEEDASAPQQIRENMLNLCNYVDKQTVECMREPTTEKIIALIDINRNISQGLLESLNAALDESEKQAVEQKAVVRTSVDTRSSTPAPQAPPPSFKIDTDV